VADEDELAAALRVPLTPEEVLQQRFPRAIMGYDRTEVDYFLEVVAVQQRDLMDQVRDLESAPRPPTGPGSGPYDAKLAEVLDRAARIVGERRRAHSYSPIRPAADER
jgi:DivIVA domain-containing protein